MILNFHPLASIIFSLLIINGFINLSIKGSNYLNKFLKINDKQFLVILNFFLIINFVSVLTFVYSLIFKFNLTAIQTISIFMILIGFYKPSYLKLLSRPFKNNKIILILIYLILFFYFLLSVSPITDPDSLDYHITVPLYQLNFQDSPFLGYWLTSQLSGAGESFLIYGLSLGAYNLSQVLQFFSLLSLILLVLNFKNFNYEIDQNNRFYISLSILLIPVFVFLISTSKPQLFPTITNIISLLLVIFYLPKSKNKFSLIYFSIIIFLLFCSTQYKFSFFLSSGIIYFLALIVMIKKKLLIKSIFVSFIIFSAVILPRELYEYINLNDNIIYNFLNPITDNFAAENFNRSLKHGTGNSPLFPYWIFFPFPEFDKITYSLGFTVLYFILIFDFKKKNVKKVLIISIFFIILALVFAQPVGRFFLEPFLWLLLISLFSFQNKKKSNIVFIDKALLFAGFIFVIILGYYSLNLTKGNINNKFYQNVLKDNADGYMLYNWANNVLPDDVVIISTHRSLSFYKHKAVSYEFRFFPNSLTKDGFNFYLDKIIKEKPQFILYSSTEHNTKNDVLKNCRGILFEYKKDVGFTAGRNPFFKKKYYDGYIYKLDIEKLKNCKI